MQEILILLIAIKQYIKQYHWQAKSYQEHILADKLEEGLEDYIDEVAELSIVAELSEKQVKAKDLLDQAAQCLGNEDKANLLSIMNLFVSLSEEVNAFEEKAEALGLKDLCGRLSNTILRKIYLIQLQDK